MKGRMICQAALRAAMKLEKPFFPLKKNTPCVRRRAILLRSFLPACTVAEKE